MSHTKGLKPALSPLNIYFVEDVGVVINASTSIFYVLMVMIANIPGITDRIIALEGNENPWRISEPAADSVN